MNASATKPSSTDWDRVDAQRDADIDTSEVGELDDAYFRRAELRVPAPKRSVTIRLDDDVVEWFRGQGRGYQTRINAVLRLYMEARKKAGE